MKVKDYMQKYPVTLDQDKLIRDALRIFINRQIHAVLITKKKKLVGIITQEDILQNLFPSIQDVIEGTKTIDKEKILEDNLIGMIDHPLKEYMIGDVKTVTPSTTIMSAQSLMLVNNFSHVPVVNKDGDLLGIISQSDIFKALVSGRVPFDSDEEYHDWLSEHWDLVQRKRNRYSIEVASIERILDEHGFDTVVDVGAGTGGHDIELIGKRYKVFGLERSKKMYDSATAKWNILSSKQQANLRFIYGNDYGKMIGKLKGKFDVVIYMGNALAHSADSYKSDLRSVYRNLPKRGCVMMQIANAEKVFASRGGFQDFNIAQSREGADKKYAFLEFYQSIDKRDDKALLNMMVLHHNGNRWVTAAVNSTEIAVFTRDSITKLLEKTGFSTIKIYGSRHGESLFQRAFDPVDDDWINVVAFK